MNLWIATQPAHEASKGGVELLERRLENASSIGPWDSVTVLPRSGLRPMRVMGLDARSVVYTQAGGTLGSAWSGWLLELEEFGVTLVEQNVFAQPSRFRRSKTHRLCLLTADGVDRFVVRSRLAGIPPPSRVAILPNPLLHDIPVGSNHQLLTGSLRFLRIGRPDMRKWTGFEILLVTTLAQRHPDVHFSLELMGHPTRGVVDVAEPNITVRTTPYAPNVLAALQACDVLLHHSRIGETYGNVLSEAARAGRLVCCALDPVWDCGPLDFLDPPHVLGAPDALLRQAREGDLLPLLRRRPPAWRGLELPAWLELLHRVASAPATAFGRATPPFSASLRRLHDTNRVLGAPPLRTLMGTVGREAVRQNLHRRRGKDEVL